MGKTTTFGKPKIGVTGPDRGGGAAWLFTAVQVLLAGGTPIRIRPSKPEVIENLQALIIGGGADVDPNAYLKENFIDEYLNQTLKNKRKSFFNRIWSFFWLLIYPIIFLIRILLSRKRHQLDKERDRLEFKLLHDAVQKGIPVLGICRGAQLINVYFKGTLHQDINTFYDEEPNRASILPVKKVFVEPNSKLAKILQANQLRVNALHNQAVKEKGQDIKIVAKEANHVVQAIESVGHDFIVGVQWHPEYLIQFKRQRRIFQALVKSTKAAKVKHLTEGEGVSK